MSHGGTWEGETAADKVGMKKKQKKKCELVRSTVDKPGAEPTLENYIRSPYLLPWEGGDGEGKKPYEEVSAMKKWK